MTLRCRHRRLKRLFDDNGHPFRCPDCWTAPGETLTEFWRQKMKDERKKERQTVWMFYIFMGRLWLALALAFAGGWMAITPILPGYIGEVMAVLALVAAVLSAPTFDFIKQMNSETEE